MATIKDVAKKAGVSVSTVSYALSGVRPVSEATRRRVLEAISALNYHPNLLARGLINKRTRIIALLYPMLAVGSLDDLPIEFIASITNVTYQHNYELLLLTHPQDEAEILRIINQGIVDGVILMEVLRQDPRAALMKKHDFPFSLIGHSAVNDGISFVDVDFYTALRQAVQYLAGLGHREVAFLPAAPDIDLAQHNYLFESFRGFKETSAELGVRAAICGCAPTLQGGYAALKMLLTQRPKVSAVIAGNELIYNGVSQALREMGRRVPKDFSVIAEISHRVAERYTPQVSNLSIPAVEMGGLGAEFLIGQLEDADFAPQQVLLPAELVARATTGPAQATSGRKISARA